MSGDDPRAALRALVAADGGESLASLSRLIGRNEAYLQQWVTRGSPRVLAEADRAVLARYLGVAEAVLGGPAAPAQASERVRVPRLDAAAAAGPGAVNEGEATIGEFGFPPRLLRALGVRGDALATIRARGWSMEPGIVDGVTLVKRVRRVAGRLVVTSDHPDAPPVTGDEVEVVGRVVWLGRAVR